jgi:hypothetical protein
MHHHCAAWKIPLEIIDNNDQWEIFAAAVRVRLTTLRSQFKDRVRRFIFGVFYMCLTVLLADVQGLRKRP